MLVIVVVTETEASTGTGTVVLVVATGIDCGDGVLSCRSGGPLLSQSGNGLFIGIHTNNVSDES